ncbi:transposase [Siminovitchia sp. FSL H7-0308]|uniref:Transposase n=1 Tax=Siminovitchia thermophila TaxID=1245522 RepID=A0ABS2R0I2_9BACI|nr:transposase [Siminovitchia thermophila]MBM7713148.1 transposase [Siminovitchia thermophila]ONK24824.1 hypothetical protein BLX87_03025 [Bacillus sp. VT-16-64]
MKQKRYNQECKQTIVELYRSGTSVSDLNREYGVSEVTIYKWIKALSPEGSDGLSSAEIAEIQKENLRLKQEGDILKKAMTIFAKK